MERVILASLLLLFMALPAAADPPLGAPVVLTGDIDQAGAFVLHWTAAVTYTGLDPEKYTITKTPLLGGAATTIDVAGDVHTYTDTARDLVSYTISWTSSVTVGIPSDPVNDPGTWPHCAPVFWEIDDGQLFVDPDPSCLFPLPDIHP